MKTRTEVMGFGIGERFPSVLFIVASVSGGVDLSSRVERMLCLEHPRISLPTLTVVRG